MIALGVGGYLAKRIADDNAVPKTSTPSQPQA